MCTGRITSRDPQPEEKLVVCSMCGFGPVVLAMINRHVDFVPLKRLQQHGTSIERDFRLCGECLTEDGELEEGEHERQQGKKPEGWPRG